MAELLLDERSRSWGHADIHGDQRTKLEPRQMSTVWFPTWRRTSLTSAIVVSPMGFSPARPVPREQLAAAGNPVIIITDDVTTKKNGKELRPAVSAISSWRQTPWLVHAESSLTPSRWQTQRQPCEVAGSHRCIPARCKRRSLTWFIDQVRQEREGRGDRTPEIVMTTDKGSPMANLPNNYALAKARAAHEIAMACLQDRTSRDLHDQEWEKYIPIVA